MFAEQSPYSIYIDVATVNCLTSGSRHNRPPIEVCVSLNYSPEEWEERDKAKVRLGGEEQTVDYNWYIAPYFFKSISKQWTEISWCYFSCLLFLPPLLLYATFSHLHCSIEPYTWGGVRVTECLPVHRSEDGGRTIFIFYPHGFRLDIIDFLTGDDKGLIGGLVGNCSDDEI